MSTNNEALAGALSKVTKLDVVNARLQKAGLPPMDNVDAAVLALVRASGIKSQGDAAVLAVNVTGGAVQAETLTEILKAGFPGAKIGARHGPHYLSLARTGKLEGVEAATIPHSARRQKTATVVTVAGSGPGPSAHSAPETPPVEPKVEVAPPATDKLREELAALSQKDLAARAKALGVKAMGKKEAIIDAVIAAS